MKLGGNVNNGQLLLAQFRDRERLRKQQRVGDLADELNSWANAVERFITRIKK